MIQRALEKRRLTLEVAPLRRALSLQEGLEGRLVGNSPAIQRVRDLILDVANSPVDELIRGETGTGKEVVARALHEHSQRSKSPYVALNCDGLPDTLLDSELFGHKPGAFTGAQKRRIEHANGGTLFLDELESMPMGVQIKLLRVLQERSLERLGSNQTLPVDVRVVAATKDDLLARAHTGSCRTDLVYRLNVVTIELPPLRELGNVADALVLGVGPQWASPAVQTPRANIAEAQSLSQQVEQYERQLIDAALAQNDGNISLTARSLQTPKTTLVNKLRKHGLGKSAA